jgi:hypothetical protein
MSQVFSLVWKDICLLSLLQCQRQNLLETEGTVVEQTIRAVSSFYYPRLKTYRVVLMRRLEIFIFPATCIPRTDLFAIISFRGLYNSSKNFRRTRRLASSYRHFQYKMVMVGGCHAYESGDTVPFQVLRWCCMSDCGTSRILCGGCTCVTAYNSQSVNLGLVECASSMP